MRFILDAVPAVDDITETEVMTDADVGWGTGKIALIDVSGVIVDATGPSLLGGGENPVGRFVEALERARDDARVKAIIVRINSPGGTVTASDIMHREVQHFKRESGKPVVVLMGDVAASGGYYLACAGDEIIAHPTTVTGSIGVIIQTINFSEGMRRIGIHADAITSGPNKAMGSPFEPMPEDHRELLQGIVNEFYGQFVDVVTSSRPGLSVEARASATDGRVVTGVRAAEIGLVDGLGDLRVAFDVAKKRAGMSSAKLVKYHRPLEHVGSAYAYAPNMPATGTQLNLLQLNVNAGLHHNQPGFYYLWDPAAWWGDAATK
jgi:protease-4